MKGLAKILLAVASVTLIVASCSRGPRVIPQSKMEKIINDMLLADQWLESAKVSKYAVDTTLFYEPIFRKYGYDTDDYLASIEYYMRDPLKFSRMVRKLALKMEADAKRLRGGGGGSSLTEESELEDNDE